MNKKPSIMISVTVISAIYFSMAYVIDHYFEALFVFVMFLLLNRYNTSAKFREKVDPYF